MKRRAFTLIELLVVISIIALLIAILLPALGSARKAARDMVCSSNQRQITTAFANHAVDHDGYYSYTGSGSDDWFAIHHNKGYISSHEVVECPRTVNKVEMQNVGAMRVPLPDPSNPSNTINGEKISFYPGLNDAADNAHDTTGHSYETFSWSSTGIWPGNAVVNRNEMMNEDLVGRTTQPSNTYVVLDSDQDPVNGGVFGGETVYNNLPDEASNNHGGRGLNISFLDGHSRFVSRDEYIEVAAKAGKMGAINLVRAQTYEPNIQRLSRPDGGPGYFWRIAN